MVTTLTFEGRNMGPVMMYFASVKVNDGSHAPLDYEVGVDRDWFKNTILPEKEKLEAAGVLFK